MVKRANPGATLLMAKPSVCVMGGRGRRPSTMRCKYSMPLRLFSISGGGTPTLPAVSLIMPKSEIELATLRASRRRCFCPPLFAIDGEGERQGSRILDLLHRERGGHLGDFDAGNELLVEAVVGGDVGHDHAQEVINIPAHAIELHDFWEVDDGRMEFLQPGKRVLIGLDGDKHRDARVHPWRIEDRHAPLDHARLFQLLDATPAGRGR